jgi:phage N-6-adenine-methyltransferase
MGRHFLYHIDLPLYILGRVVVAGMKMPPLRSIGLDTYRTPEAIFGKLNEEFHFDFDPCPSGKINYDGLCVEWGKSNFINPPYSEIYKWLQKGIIERNKGKTSVFLIPSRTGNKWFHELVLPEAYEIRFIRGRICFSENPAPFDSMVVVLK